MTRASDLGVNTPPASAAPPVANPSTSPTSNLNTPPITTIGGYSTTTPPATIVSPSAMMSGDLKSIKNSVKSQHTNQLTKITFKSEADVEFLEVVKEYFVKRAELESTHAKNIEKLSKTISARRFRKYLGTSNAPLFRDQKDAVAPEPLATTAEDGANLPLSSSPASAAPVTSPTFSLATRQIYKSFMSLLEESEVQSKKRATMSETLEDSIAKVLKDFYKLKTILTKKNIEFGKEYHQEILLAYDELEKTRALYDKAAKDADVALKKYNDAFAKPKAGLSALKNFVTGKDAGAVIEKLSAKHRQKVHILDGARNNYLLSLLALNAVQKIYDTEDLPQLMAKVDGFFYDVFGTLLQKYTKVEQELSTTIITSMSNILAQKSQLSRDKDIAAFTSENASVFKPHPLFVFEAVGGDEKLDLVVDDVSKRVLGQKMGELMALDAALVKQQEQKENEMKGAEQLLQIPTATSPSIGSSPVELTVDIQNALDLIKCQRTKLLIQIETLESCKVVPIMPENSDPPVSKTHAITKLNYTPTGDNDGELLVIEGDELEILTAQADAPVPEGWVRAKNMRTQAIGNLPASCLAFVSKPPPKGKAGARIVVAIYDHRATDENELNFAVGDEIECAERVDIDEDDWEGRLIKTGEIGLFPKICTRGWENVAALMKADFEGIARVAAAGGAPPQMGGRKRPISVLLEKKRERAASVAPSAASSTIPVMAPSTLQLNPGFPKATAASPAITHDAPNLISLAAAAAPVELGKVSALDIAEEEDQVSNDGDAESITQPPQPAEQQPQPQQPQPQQPQPQQPQPQQSKSHAQSTPSQIQLAETKMANLISFLDESDSSEDSESESEQVLFSAVALYSYVATCEGELTLEKGEVVYDISKNTGSDQWWTGFGRHGEGQFPAQYVRPVEQSAPAPAPAPALEVKGRLSLVSSNHVKPPPVQRVRAMYDFAPAATGELGFKAGDILVLKQGTEVDWWDGELNGIEGAFPASYVERLPSDS